MPVHNTPEEKADILDKLGIEVMPGLQRMTTQQRMEYSKETYGIEFLLDSMSYSTPLGPVERFAHKTHDYQCGHCNRKIAGIIVALNLNTHTLWLGCPSCKKGSVQDDKLVPPSLFGDEIKGLPAEVKSAYLEARTSFSYGCYTACELMCRKILMNVAVDKDADKNLKFAQYVDYLNSKRYTPVTMETAIEKIKDNGNEATHEIKVPEKERAKNTLDFTMLLLKNVYEIPELLKQPDSP